MLDRYTLNPGVEFLMDLHKTSSLALVVGEGVGSTLPGDAYTESPP